MDNLDLSGYLEVSGNIYNNTVGSNAYFYNIDAINIDISQNLTVNGNTILNDASITNLDVSGQSNLYDISAHSLDLSGNLTVDGNFTINQFLAGYGNTTSAVDAIQFKFDSGNIDAGTIQLIGIT